jgi:hypothetical protein
VHRAAKSAAPASPNEKTTPSGIWIACSTFLAAGHKYSAEALEDFSMRRMAWVSKPRGPASGCVRRPFTASAVVSRVLQHIRAWMIHSYQDKHSNHIVARCSP